MKEKLGKKISGYLVTGILVSAPALVSLLVFWFVFGKLDIFLGNLLARWITFPNGSRVPGLGIITFLIVMFLIGLFTRNYLGKKAINFAQKIFNIFPVLRTIYNAVQKVSDVIITQQKVIFKTPVLVMFPHAHAYSIGFITSRPDLLLPDGRKAVMVYVPTTPNPTSGYMLMFPEDEVCTLDISIEDAIRLIISAGVTAQDILGGKTVVQITKGDQTPPPLKPSI
ncbi:DUF502 domain-containing protein [bacterium]|nr:DUF502 domain-containing protein [bacterium]